LNEVKRLYAIHLIGEASSLKVKPENSRLVDDAWNRGYCSFDVGAMWVLLDCGAGPNARCTIPNAHWDMTIRSGRGRRRCQYVPESLEAASGILQRAALIQALRRKQEEVAALLLEHGTDPNLADSEGCTPLMFASQGGNLAAVQMLLVRGAALDCVELRGWSAFHCACDEGHVDIAELLVREDCDTALRDI
jgi:ankyrin repeat protein